MDIEGKIIFDLGEQSGLAKSTGNPWKKHEWVLETTGAYPRKVKFTVFGENRCNDMQFELNNSYRVSVDIESREFNGRWYTDVNAYAMAPLDAAGGFAPQGQPAAPAAPAAPAGGTAFPGAAPAPMADPFAGGGAASDSDDLPF